MSLRGLLCRYCEAFFLVIARHEVPKQSHHENLRDPASLTAARFPSQRGSFCGHPSLPFAELSLFPLHLNRIG